jgi:PleD family two-component response regulator
MESPLVLVVSDGEWAGRSLESVLQAHDCVVTRSTRGADAVAAIQRAPVDAVIVEEQLKDMTATEFCQLVRRDSAGMTTPIIVIASRGISPRRRVETYAAGAWDYCSQPLDLDVLLLKLKTFVSAKRELSDPGEQAFVDPVSDLYTLRGFRRWSRELSARATRAHEPLSCLALAPLADNSAVTESADTAMEGGQWLARAARFVARHRRESDVAAYVGNGTFAILAPATGPDGAEQFSERLKRAAHDQSATDEAVPVELQVGFSAVGDLASAAVNGEELLRRASTALSHLRRSGRLSAVLGFDNLTT